MNEEREQLVHNASFFLFLADELAAQVPSSQTLTGPAGTGEERRQHRGEGNETLHNEGIIAEKDTYTEEDQYYSCSTGSNKNPCIENIIERQGGLRRSFGANNSEGCWLRGISR